MIQTTPTANSDEELTHELARLIMRWRRAPGRYLKPERGWIPIWKFKPLSNLDDAFSLAKKAAAIMVLNLSSDGLCSVDVKVAGRPGRATHTSVATAITISIARAVGLEAPEVAAAPAPGRSVRTTSEGQPR